MTILESLKANVSLNAKRNMQLKAFKTDKERILWLNSLLGIKTGHRAYPNRFETISDKPVPKVYSYKGELLNFWKQKNKALYNTSEEKHPDESNGWYGVEIECYLNKADFEGEASYGEIVNAEFVALVDTLVTIMTANVSVMTLVGVWATT